MFDPIYEKYNVEVLSWQMHSTIIYNKITFDYYIKNDDFPPYKKYFPLLYKRVVAFYCNIKKTMIFDYYTKLDDDFRP